MAGHSKWANIKHKKAKEDAKRGKAFTKMIKEITIVARDGGGDPSHNPRLRLLIDKAKHINMPQENIMRAIKKGTGELPGVAYEACTYEGYGPHGIAVIVDVLTDNKNRMAADIRRLFSKNGGSLGESGSVNWMFEKMGVVTVSGENLSEDALLEALLEFDINNISCEEKICSITCDMKALMAVKTGVQEAGYCVEDAQIEWVPKTPTSVSEEQAESVYEFLTILDDHDDVQNIYSNLGS